MTSKFDEERSYYIGKWGVRGLEAACIAATPVYLVQSLRKGTFSLRGLARYNWIVPLVGGVVGTAVGTGMSVQSNSAQIIAKTTALRMDAKRVRQDDYHLIGSVVGALLLPAIFLRRVGLINGLLGGAGLGGGIALATHAFQTYGADGLLKEGQKAFDEAKQRAGQAADEGARKAGDIARDAQDKAEELGEQGKRIQQSNEGTLTTRR